MIHLPEVFHVGTATADDFLNPYKWVNDEEKNVCPVLYARFARDHGKIDAYAKLVKVDTAAGQIECINEISGWLIARACALPVAETAFMTTIYVRDLPDHPLVREYCSDPNAELFFFCTSEISRTQAVGIVPNEALLEEQAQWAHCHATIALDEWLANTDRHLGNLVRKAKNDFALIDHGQLLRRIPAPPPWWQTGELPDLENQPMVNLLHRHVYHCRNITAGPAVTAGFTQCAADAAKQAQNMRKALHEIAFWCSTLAPGHSAAWLNFLHNRTMNARDLLAHRFSVFSFA